MLAIIAAALFAIAFLLNAAGAGDGPVFTAFSLMLAGLACLAMHEAGYGTAGMATPPLAAGDGRDQREGRGTSREGSALPCP